MKKIFITLIILLSSAISHAQYYAKYDKPVEITMTPADNLAKDKALSTRLKEMKKTFEAEKVVPMHWSDGTDRLLLYYKKKKGEEYPTFTVRTLDGDYLMGRVTHVDKFSFEGRDYYYGRNMNEFSKNCVVTVDGKSIYSDGCSFAIIDYEGDKVFTTSLGTSRIYYSLDGSRSFYGGDNAFQYLPSVKPGVHSIPVGTEVIDMLSEGTDGFLYIDEMYEGLRFNYSSCQKLDGTKIDFAGTGSMSPFPAKESGYMVSNKKFEPVIEIISRNIDGKSLIFKELRGFNDLSKYTLYTNNGKVVIKDGIDITYSAPDHSIHYSVWDYDNHRKVRGAVFLRDSTLNIPPLFNEVAYNYDETAGKWKPYVRTELFGSFVPYTPGMDASPKYADEGEKLIDQGDYWKAVFDHYRILPDTHKWTAKEIALVNHAAMRYTKERLLGDLSRIEYTEHGISSTKSNADMARTFIKYIDDGNYKTLLYYADQINKKVAGLTKDAALKSFAEESSKMIADYETSVTDMAANIHSLYQAMIDADAKKSTTSTAVSTTFRDKVMEATAATSHKQQYNNDFLMTGVMMLVNNAVRRVTGGGNVRGNSNLRVTYVPGGNPGQTYSAPVTTGSESTSGAAVKTSPKCSACGGTGSCNACRGHVGKATSGNSNRECSGCHGDGRCYICGGSGYKSL